MRTTGYHWPLKIVEVDGVLMLLDARGRGEDTLYRARPLDAERLWRLRVQVAKRGGWPGAFYSRRFRERTGMVCYFSGAAK